MTPEQIEQALNAAFRAWGLQQSRVCTTNSHARDILTAGKPLSGGWVLPVGNSPALAAGAFSQGV